MTKLKYSNQVLKTTALFYSNFNDLDIFVEDKGKGDYEFYLELLKKLTEEKVKIRKIFQLGGRDKVIEACKKENNKKNNRKSVYIIDGDIDLILNESIKLDKLFILDVYCIENYLIEKEAIIDIIHETLGVESKGKIEKKLNFDICIKSISKNLIKFFLLLAISKKYNLGIKFGNITELISNNKGKPYLDKKKLNVKIQSLKKELIKEIKIKKLKEELSLLERLWGYSPETLLKIVSGKDYLLPLVNFKIKCFCPINIKTESLKIRLVKKVSLNRMEELKKYLLN